MNDEDRWVHRSEFMKCETCMWYVAKLHEDAHVDLGRCRRHAPTMSGYPVVYAGDFCGDHKIDEGKV